MALEEKLPNVTWKIFAAFNENATDNFENMCRELFSEHFLDGAKLTHSNPNNPGIEVEPVLEKIQDDGSERRRISFQAKYFENRINYTDIKNSALQTVKHYKRKVDLVYLFCNQIVSTRNKSYLNIKDILAKADIELIPISNCELLDMIRRYPRIARYYFTPDRHQYNLACFACARNIQLDTTTAGQADIAEVPLKEEYEHLWLKGTIAEKINRCKEEILALNLKPIRNEINLMLNEHIGEKADQDILQFYHLLILLDDGKRKEYKDNKDKVSGQYIYDLETVETSIENGGVDYFNFIRLRPESQVILLDLVFKKQSLNTIDEVYRKVIVNPDTVDASVKKQINFYYGLSSFNQREYGRAYDCLKEIDRDNSNIKISFYTYCSWLMYSISAFNPTDENQIRIVMGIWDRFLEVKKHASDQTSCNEVLVAEIELNTCRFLGAAEERYLQEAMSRYESYPDSVRSEPIVKILFALCCEMDGQFDKAIDVYSDLDWKTNSDIAVRILMALIRKGDYNKATACFSELNTETITARTTGAYLLALSHVNLNQYRQELNNAIDVYAVEAGAFLGVVFYIENEDVFNEIAMPVLDSLTRENGDFFSPLTDMELNAYLVILAHFKCIKYIQPVLAYYGNLNSIDNFTANEVYSAFYSILTAELEMDVEHEKLSKKSDCASVANAVADTFLSTGRFKKQFLQIKYLCAARWDMHISMLKYAKQLFEITNDSVAARNIVALLCERNVILQEEYDPYLSILEKSEVPEHSMIAASANLKLGNDYIANKFAYRALYLLDDYEDFNIFKSYFAFYNHKLRREMLEGYSVAKRVKGGTVVVLKMCASVSEQIDDGTLTVCLDSEAEFDNSENCSLGVRHVCRSNILFSKLCGSNIGKEVNIEGIRYKVCEVIDRDDYAFRYILEKIRKAPENFKGAVWMIESEDPEKMMERVKAVIYNPDRKDNLLKVYNFGINSLGISIDNFASSDYDRYLSTLCYLLFQKDGAFYAGEPYPCCDCNEGYIVPTLSTFVILAVMGWLDILVEIKERIIIPDSYIQFFRDRYDHEKDSIVSSKESLVFMDDGKPALVKKDSREIEIWDSIISVCDEFKAIHCDDEDRIKLLFYQDCTVERIFSVLRIDGIQLDALLLAQQKNAIYLCDDLLFRKIAAVMGIRSINFTALLYDYMTDDYVMDVIEKLSKTNYVWMPLFTRNRDESNKIIQNLLSGTLKKKIYRSILAINYLNQLRTGRPPQSEN